MSKLKLLRDCDLMMEIYRIYNVSGREVARRMGCSCATVVNWSHSGVPMRESTLLKLWKEFPEAFKGKSVEYCTRTYYDACSWYEDAIASRANECLEEKGH